MLDEALGENRAYYLRHGYHADILRDTILETLPVGWRERLVSVPGCHAAHALDPHDLAAVKLLIGRPKDISLLAHLHAADLIDGDLVRARLDLIKSLHDKPLSVVKNGVPPVPALPNLGIAVDLAASR